MLIEAIVAIVVFIIGVLMLANPPSIHWLTKSRYKNNRMSEATMERFRQGLGVLFIVVAILIVVVDLL